MQGGGVWPAVPLGRSGCGQGATASRSDRRAQVLATAPAAADGGGENAASAAFRKWALAAVAASLAETVTFPLDVSKVRLQLQNELGKSLVEGAPPEKAGMLRTLVNVGRYEGFTALYRGLPAAVIRQAVYGGIGIGAYPTVRKLLTGGDVENASFWQRILAGCVTGGLGQFVASPTDVVKVRMQADGRLKLLGKPPRYSGTFDAFRRIPAEEGFKGYYRGLAPSMYRAAVINGTGIAVYDHSKRIVHRVLGTNEGLGPQVLGSLLSGLASALVSTPFDVVKTRLMNREQGTTVYRGMVDCAVKTVRSEGLGALYKGFTPAYARLAPWQLVFFPTFEKLSAMFGGDKI